MTLSSNMQNIAHAANSLKPASLEETAASLEEITSNITNNTQTTPKWQIMEKSKGVYKK